MIHGGHRVLPELRRRDPGPEVPGARAHVAVEQLEPRASEGVGELVGVLVEALRDRGVDRVDLQREVGGEHHRRVALRGVVRVRHGALGLGVLRPPLLRPGGALGELPVVLEEVLEEAVVPPRRVVGPRALEAAGDGVRPLAGAVLVLPAEALLLEGGALRLGAHVALGVRGAVRLAEGVAADDERHRLLVVHGHAGEGLSDVARGGQRVGLAAGALGVHVDQAHLHGAQGPGELAIAAVALVPEPGVLGAPEEVLGLPHVGASEAEAEGLEAHRLHGHVAGEHHQVGPRDLLAVLLLERPQQPARLVEVGVVGPAVEGREALLPFAAAAAPVGGAVGARRVPGEADEEGAVVTVVRGPPVLRGGHHRDEVSPQGLDVERRELRGVGEVVLHRVRQARVVVQHREVELVGPPVLVRARPALLRGRRGNHGVLCLADALGVLLVGHVNLFSQGGRSIPPET